MSGFVHPMSQLVHCTVRISCVDEYGNQSSGSGYIYNFGDEKLPITCIVTNKHVVQKGVRGSFNLTLKKDDDTPDLGVHDSIVLENIGALCIPHPVAEVDLVAIPIAAALKKASDSGRHYYYVILSAASIVGSDVVKGLSPMEDVVMIGYPIGLWDSVNNYPIIRKGITATHPALNLNGKPEFLIDAACFPGSSGSPVFLANFGGYTDKIGSRVFADRVGLLGTLYSGPQHSTVGELVVVDIPTDTKSVAVGAIPTNLGYVINCNELSVLDRAVRDACSNWVVSRNSSCVCGSGKRFKNCCGAF